MARVRLARSKLYRRRRLPTGARRPRSYYGKTAPMVRGIRGAMRGIYGYKQIVLNPTALGPISLAAASGDFLAGYNFQLSQVGGNVGPFTALYDQYRIAKVVWQLVPKWNVSDVNTTAGGGNLPMIATCIDYDDSNTPPNYGDVLQRQNAKIHRGAKIITRVFKPCANFVVDATTGALNAKQSPWLDVQNINVPHYGVKLAIQGPAVALDFDVIVKYYLQFRQVR